MELSSIPIYLGGSIRLIDESSVRHRLINNSEIGVSKMAEDDIYGNKIKYENFINNLDRLVIKPDKKDYRRKYYCRNKVNLKHFKRLIDKFETKDISYVRRNRVLQTLIFIADATEKDFASLERDDIDSIIAKMHITHKTANSKQDFIKAIKYAWKILFPEIDDRGRIDDSQTPYVVRHISGKIDISKEKARNDKMDFDEFKRIVTYFSNNITMQSYLTIATESLARPQELLYTRIKDVKLNGNYALINISEHGKEGTKIIYCIESYPYFIKMYNNHPDKTNPNAFLFLNNGRNKSMDQLKPKNINLRLRKACRDLKIEKGITCYSLKRFGVTFKRLQGEDDVTIQRTAGWTSNKQLKVYDKSNIQDIIKKQLIKKGLIANDGSIDNKEIMKRCNFCNEIMGMTDTICQKCLRIVDKKLLEENELRKDREIDDLKAKLQSINELLVKHDAYFDALTRVIDKKSFKEEIIKELK